MRNALLAGALGLTLLSSAALAQDPVYASPAGGASSPIDRQFAGQAAASNTFEIRSSQMALRRSRDPAVLDMAHWMIESHTMAEHNLQAAATYADYQGGAVPVETPDTSAMLASLAGLSGPAFDEAYVADQIAGHEMTARQYKDYAVQGSYGPLLHYEAMTLPAVEDHLAHFQYLQAHMMHGMHVSSDAQ